MEKEILIQELVKIIHKNCKLSVEEIATMLNTTTVAVAELIDELEKDGTIKGYGAKINWDNVKGSNTVTAYIELKVTPQMTNGFDRIAERIYQFPQVTSLNRNNRGG